MRKNHILHVMLVCMALGIPLILPAQVSGGCCLSPTNDPSGPRILTDAPRTIQDVERDISRTKEGIDNRSRYAAEARNEAAHKKMEMGLFGLAGGTSSYVESQLSRAAGFEKDNLQAKRELAELEQEKRRLTREARGCFLPDTLVTMADGSAKPFKRLQPGELVLTYDIGYQITVNKPVVEVYTVEGNHLYTINGELTTTGGERLLSRTGWKQVSDLQKGDFVHMNGRMVEIDTIDYQRTDNTLYNIQVGDSHNFYVVTDNGSRYLVHNSSGGGGGGGAGK